MAKTCVICHEDCAGKPRTKDAKGRYYCQPCYDEALARKRARQKAPEPELAPGPFFNIPDEPPIAAPAAGCPGCQHPISPGAALCVNCGFDLQTGAALQTEVATPQKKKRESGGTLSVGMICLLVTTVLIVGLFGATAATGGLGPWLIGMLIMAVFSLWVGLRTVYEAYQSSGILLALACFFVPLVGTIWLLIGGSRLLKIAFALLMVCAVFGYTLLFTHEGLQEAAGSR